VIGIDESLVSDPAARESAWESLSAKHRRDTFVRWRHEVVALMQESEELVEAMPKGVVIRSATLMPFSD